MNFTFSMWKVNSSQIPAYSHVVPSVLINFTSAPSFQGILEASTVLLVTAALTALESIIVIISFPSDVVVTVHTGQVGSSATLVVDNAKVGRSTSAPRPWISITSSFVIGCFKFWNKAMSIVSPAYSRLDASSTSSGNPPVHWSRDRKDGGGIAMFLRIPIYV